MTLGMWIFSILGFLGLAFAFCSAQRETGTPWTRIGDHHNRHRARISDGERLPISEDCDSKFGIGFMAARASVVQPRAGKGFPEREQLDRESKDR